MGYSPWGCKESDVTKVTERACTGKPLTDGHRFQNLRCLCQRLSLAHRDSGSHGSGVKDHLF